jgi:hypothetical protein
MECKNKSAYERVRVDSAKSPYITMGDEIDTANFIIEQSQIKNK